MVTLPHPPKKKVWFTLMNPSIFNLQLMNFLNFLTPPNTNTVYPQNT